MAVKVLVTAAVNVTDWPAAAGLGVDVSVVVEATAFMTCVTVFEVADAKLVSPLYCTVIKWDPIGSAAEVKDAVPLLRVELPSQEAPSKKATVPVGVPPVPVTVTFNVIATLNAEGLMVEVRTAVAAVPVTDCATAVDVLEV